MLADTKMADHSESDANFLHEYISVAPKNARSSTNKELHQRRLRVLQAQRPKTLSALKAEKHNAAFLHDYVGLPKSGLTLLEKELKMRRLRYLQSRNFIEKTIGYIQLKLRTAAPQSDSQNETESA